MTEPTSITAGTLAATAGAITLTGSFLGLEYELLLIGMLGGLIALSFMASTSRRRMAISVATSALLAGYATPVLAIMSISWMPSLRAVKDPLTLLLALLVGIATQTAIPAGLRFLSRRLGDPGDAP